MRLDRRLCSIPAHAACCVLLAFALPVAARAQPATMAKDIRTVPDASVGLLPTAFTAQGANVYFVGNSDDHGAELWASDGTAAGTRLVKDIWPGASVLGLEEAGSSWPREITAAGPLVFFTADDGNTGRELWRSDGTEAGTFLLKDVQPGAGSAIGQNAFISVVGSQVLFFADDGVSGRELWRSDGTTAGTVQVMDLCEGPCGSVWDYNRPAVLQDRLYFAGYGGDPILGGLWTSDGTSAGTERLTPVTVNYATQTTATASHVYFVTDNSLWQTDGTTAGTRLVEDFGSTFAFLANLTGSGDDLFFTAIDDATGMELWKSDGTAAGTTPVKDIDPGPASSYPRFLVAAGPLVYFVAHDAEHGDEVWRSDGTDAGTTLLLDINPGTVSSYAGGLLEHEGRLVFVAFLPLSGLRLWWSDGTAVGTHPVGSVSPAYFETPSLASATGAVYLAGYGSGGTELWKSDGTDAGTVQVFDLASVSSNPFALAGLDQRAVFAASGDTTGLEPWASDGTSAGTVILGDLCSGPCPSLWSNHLETRSSFVRLGDEVLFPASANAQGNELWRTDGTPGGTGLLADSLPGPQGSTPRDLTRAGSRVFYVGSRESGDSELWATDGTAAGTGLVRDIYPGASSSSPGSLTAVGERVFFTATDNVVGTELWRSDGTFAGTAPVGDLFPGPYAPYIVETAAWADVLAYREYTGYPTKQLRRSDGTASGTYPVPTDARDFAWLTDVNGLLYYRAWREDTGLELWRTNGLPGGTRLVADIAPGPAGSYPTRLVSAGGLLYFTASDVAHGRELWRSDGTAAGTYMVKDIVPGPGGAIPSSLTEINGRLYFAAYEPGTGVELWTSDGTAAGTSRVQDVAPGVSSSSPARLTLSGERLFFVAGGGATGRELWSLPLLPSLLLGDAPQPEGDAGVQPALFRLRVAGARTTPIVVSYATADGTASAGSDYLPSAGSLTFLPGGPDEQSVPVSVLGDTAEEPDEDFLLTLSPVAGAVVVGAPARGVVLNDDSPVTVAAVRQEIREGHSGVAPLSMEVRLSGPRGVPVTVAYATSNVTAMAPDDYESRSGVLTFAPGAVAAAVEVPVRGDRILEFDEAFRLDLSSATGATIAQAQKAVGAILNDEPSGRPGRTLAHGMRQTGDLSMPAMFRIAQDPLASYEVSVDAAGGVPYFELARMEGFGVESEPVNILAQTYGRAPSLRWFNGPGLGAEQYIRFSIIFGERGKPENVYRLRMYETTLAGPRFVNNGSQLTTLIVQNAGSEPVTGQIHFFDSEGIPRHTEPFALAARASLVKALADIPALAGVAGSLTIAHDGRYGTLVGKAVSFEAATGLCFDHLLVTRPR